MAERSFFEALTLRLSVLGDLTRMLRRSGRWWLLPMMVGLVLLGLALTGLQAVHYLSPFIYAVF
jgi:hypothetical protein